LNEPDDEFYDEFFRVLSALTAGWGLVTSNNGADPSPSSVIATWLAVSLLMGILCPSMRADDKKDNKKNEKVEPWVELRTQHFVVASDGGEKLAAALPTSSKWSAESSRQRGPTRVSIREFPFKSWPLGMGNRSLFCFQSIPSTSGTPQPEGIFVSGGEKKLHRHAHECIREDPVRGYLPGLREAGSEG